MNEIKLTREYLNLLKDIYNNDGLATAIKHELNATRKSLMIRLEGLLDVPGFPGSNAEERKQIKSFQEIERQHLTNLVAETYKSIFGYGNPKKYDEAEKEYEKYEDAHKKAVELISKKDFEYKKRVQERKQRRTYALLNYNKR